MPRITVVLPVLLLLFAGFSVANAQTGRHVCEGEFGTGSGSAGSYIGDVCRLASDSDQERAVQSACQQNAYCRVVAEVRAQGRFLLIRRVISAEAISTVPKRPVSAQRLGEQVDGVLAPLPGGCAGAQAADQRVSLLFNPPGGGPAVQMFGEYCAVVRIEGDTRDDRNLTVVVALRCGAEADDATLRRQRGGRAVDITLRRAGDGPVSIDGTSYARCPISRSTTPAWWIDRQPIFRGRPLP